MQIRRFGQLMDQTKHDEEDMHRCETCGRRSRSPIEEAISHSKPSTRCISDAFEGLGGWRQAMPTSLRANYQAHDLLWARDIQKGRATIIIHRKKQREEEISKQRDIVEPRRTAHTSCKTRQTASSPRRENINSGKKSIKQKR